MSKRSAEEELKHIADYDKDHCWQHDIRLNNLEEDLRFCKFTLDDVKDLKVSDFLFKPITDKGERKSAIEFIKRHEWLGNLSQYTTHWFGAYHKHMLAGVILMNMPNAFSKLLGEETPAPRAPLEPGLIYTEQVERNPRATEPVRETPRLVSIRSDVDAESAKDGVQGRAKVPSWDEIMFGQKKDED